MLSDKNKKQVEKNMKNVEVVKGKRKKTDSNIQTQEGSSVDELKKKYMNEGSDNKMDRLKKKFLAGAQAVIGAQPGPGARFVGWRGLCTGSRRTCTVAVSLYAVKPTITAVFRDVTRRA